MSVASIKIFYLAQSTALLNIFINSLCVQYSAATVGQKSSKNQTYAEFYCELSIECYVNNIFDLVILATFYCFSPKQTTHPSFVSHQQALVTFPVRAPITTS